MKWFLTAIFFMGQLIHADGLKYSEFDPQLKQMLEKEIAACLPEYQQATVVAFDKIKANLADPEIMKDWDDIYLTDLKLKDGLSVEQTFAEAGEKINCFASYDFARYREAQTVYSLKNSITVMDGIIYLAKNGKTLNDSLMRINYFFKDYYVWLIAVDVIGRGDGCMLSATVDMQEGGDGVYLEEVCD